MSSTGVNMATDGLETRGVVLVTAGAAGIGRAIADAFVSRGATVHICDIDRAAVEDFLQHNPRATASVTDISSLEQVDHMFDELESRHGSLDVLVNNAGIGGPTAEIADVEPSEWDRTLAVGLNGNFYCSRRAAPLLTKTQGCIINISSTAGLQGCPGRAPYVAAKWAIIGLTKTLAMELGRYGVRVNAICPGSVEGPRIRRIIDRDAKRLGRSAEDIRRAYERQTSMRVFISAEDVANMAIFLASPMGRHVSGQVIAVDGNTESFTSIFEESS